MIPDNKIEDVPEDPFEKTSPSKDLQKAIKTYVKL
jgi:hypothetical protein